MNEAETRAEHVDPALTAAGWGVVEGSRVLREHAITLGRLQGSGGKGLRAKAEIADYVLVYRNTKLAVIEAKAWDKPLTEGVGQAKSYAAKLALRFTYATNGQAIYGIDMATGAEGDVAAYPSPDELWTLTNAQPNAWRDRFAAVPFEDKGGTWQGRYYQDIAITRVLEAIEAGPKSANTRILLTLATGTGKTFIAFQIAWKLFQSRWNLADWKSGAEPTRRPRILFLADRNILADQAYNAFSAFPDDALVRIAPDDIRKKGRVPKNGSIFFTIFQTFMSGPGHSPYFGDYPADFFDFIVVDECHRGGANDEGRWRAILDYFNPAVQLGLTATPKRTLNADTYAYFGDPVFVYSLKDGINDGFLTPFKVRQIATTLDDYVYTPDDQVIEGDIEPGRRYDEKDFNRIIEIKQREAYRVKLLMQTIAPGEKTIVFCANQPHALAIRDLINQLKTSTDPDYCVRVTADEGARGEQFLREFQDNEKTIPTILTTSQKLSTGVDARSVRYIVLLRPINSMIEFKQIIGRGTRLHDGKDHFTIVDFVKAHHHFSDPEWDGEPLEPEPPTPRRRMAATEDDPFAALTPASETSPAKPRIKIRLADGKERRIQHMAATSYWSADGRPMSAAQFLENLYGVLPAFFKDEDELRHLWSAPDTRKALLTGLAEKGFDREPLAEMQKIIEAENSDLFDVLGYVAFATEPVARADRASAAKAATAAELTDKQQGFVDFVLAQYVAQGVDELDAEKLSPLLRLRYRNALSDAFAELGKPDEVRRVFTGFQRHLYAPEIRFDPFDFLSDGPPQPLSLQDLDPFAGFGPLPVAPASPSPESVLLGAAAPRRCDAGGRFTASLVAYIESARAAAMRQLEQLGEEGDRVVSDLAPAHGSHWVSGAPVSVRLSGERFDVQPPEQGFEWSGRMNAVAFEVAVRPDAPAGVAMLSFQVCVAELPMALIPMRIDIGPAPGRVDSPSQRSHVGAPRSAFASYASKDAAQVTPRLSTLVRWAPGLDVFQDCLDLMPNEAFKTQLAQQIGQREVFLLFWSRNAAASPWVRWEYDTARTTKGLDAILPMPLEDPAIAPPPQELAELHFRDRFMLAGYGLAKIGELAKPPVPPGS